jgi:hypothetical protein
MPNKNPGPTNKDAGKDPGSTNKDAGQESWELNKYTNIQKLLQMKI